MAGRLVAAVHLPLHLPRGVGVGVDGEAQVPLDGQIDQLVEKGNWAAKLTSRALDHLDAYLSASQLGITVASLALGKAIEDSVEPGVRALLQGLGLPEWKMVVGVPHASGG